MATPGRVQVPELNLRPSLSPAPVVNVQPVAPVNRQGAGNNLVSIAESLAGLSNSFARFSATSQQQNKNQDSYLAGSLAGKSYDELKTYFEQNPQLLEKEKVAMMYAGKYANTFGTDLLSGKLTADWDGTTPLDQFIAKKQEEYLSQLPEDPMIRSYFNSSANPYVQNYMLGRTKQEAENQAAADVGVLSSAATNAWEAAKASTGAANAAPGVSKRLPLLAGTQAGRQPLQMKGMQAVVLDRWEQVQGAFGRQLPIVSGYRDEKTNTAAGGAKKSQHLHGNALDIDISGLAPEEKRKLVAIVSGMGFTGLGFGENSLHVDMRPTKTVWGYGPGGTIPAWAASAAMKHKAGAFGKVPYSVNASAVAVDGIFTSISESPQFKRMTPDQRSAFWYDYAFNINPKTEDDLKVIEGILTTQRPGGAPPLSEDPNYAVKVRTLLETRKDEFRKLNTDAQSPINIQVQNAITSAAGFDELRRIRDASGNLFDAEYWAKADAQMQESLVKNEVIVTQRNAHNAGIDQARQQAKQKFAFGQVISTDAISDVQVPSPDTPGKTVTYSRKDIINDVKNDILNGIDKMAADKQLPDEAKWGLIASIFGKSNETISQWEGALASTVTSFNPAEAAKGVTDQMVTNAKLYDYLKSSGNYLYLDAHLKGQNVKQFWTMYDSFRGTGQNEREALFSTFKVMNDPNVLETARKEVNYAEGEYWKSGGQSFIKSELNGNPIAGGAVMDMATAIAATGRPADEALTQAINIYKQTHVYTMNSWIPKNLKGLPENFSDNITEYVGTYIKQYGAKANPPITDAEDVMIAPDASGGRFYLFQKSTGLPLMAKEVKGGLSRTGVLSVSMQTLSDFDKLKNDRAAIPNEANAAAMASAIAEAGGSNPPTKTVGGGRTAPRQVPLTPQEIVDQKKTAEAKRIESNILTNGVADRKKANEQFNNMPRKQRIEKAAEQWGIPIDQAEQMLIQQGALK